MTTYRNDHEASLARVAALEQALYTLRKNSEKVPRTAPPAVSRKPWPLFAASLAALTLGTFGGVALGIANSQRPSDAKPAVSAVDRTKLVECANGIEAAPLLGADLTDPRHPSPRPVAPIAATAAPCRADLTRLIEIAPLSPDERVLLWRWAVQEDELAGAISRIEVYYASDPYALDNYSTAKQLWVEYDRAHQGRNRALGE
jgi:hypothetical protein